MDNPYKMNSRLEPDEDIGYDDELRCGDMVVGMAYVPMQAWGDVYDMAEALGRGTQFAELDKPFYGEEVWS